MDQQSTTSRKVVVVGPNLPRQAKATHHVHAEGCADLQRGWIRRYVDGSTGEQGWTIEVADRLDVESAVYDFAPAETPGYVLGEFQSEFHFAPCLNDLPLGERDAAKPSVTVEQADLLHEIGDAADRLRHYAGQMIVDGERIQRSLDGGNNFLGVGSTTADLMQSSGKLDALVQVAARTFKSAEYADVVRSVIRDGRSSVRSLVEIVEAK